VEKAIVESPTIGYLLLISIYIYQSTLRKLLRNKNYCILLGDCIEIITLFITLVSYYYCSICPILLQKVYSQYIQKYFKEITTQKKVLHAFGDCI